MLIDGSHKRWVVVCLIALAVATLAYVPYATSALRGPGGGSWPGLAYGAAGLALMLYAGALGLRRRIWASRVGRATTWMKGHIWLGLLSVPLILFHSGFHVRGTLTLVLMVLFGVVVVSGVYGVVLQQFLPRQMLISVPEETVYEQIDAIVEQRRDEADRLVAAVAGPLFHVPASAVAERRGTATPVATIEPPTPGGASAAETLKTIYLADIRPYLAPGREPKSQLATVTLATEWFGGLRTRVPPALYPAVQELRAICEERRQLARQKRLHHWLHGWLLVHVPLSLALLLLSVAHAVMSIRY